MEKNRKNIVMLQDFFGLGYTYQENLLTENYRRLGHEVVVITSTFENVFDYTHEKYDPSKKKKIEDYHGAKIIRLPYSLNFFNKLRKHSGVYEILAEEKPDLIFAHDIHLNLKEAVEYQKKFPECKIIMDYHADYTNSAKNWISLNILHKLIRKPFFNRYKKYLHKIYSIVPGSTTFLNEVYDVPYDSIELLPLGCDYAKCNEVRQNTNISEIRNQFGIKKEDIVIITGGKINQLKRIHLAVDAVKRLNLKNVHLIVFGKGDVNDEVYYEQMKKNAEGYNVHFTGWIDSHTTYELMAASDIALFPCSQSVLWQQSIGMHLPLIAGDFGGQDMSYLNRNNNLIKVDAQDINEEYFSKILLELIQTPEKINLMKKGAEKTAKEFLDYEIIARRTLED
jgi:glycosyltransferase involved in cell wall biosynthesis